MKIKVSNTPRCTNRAVYLEGNAINRLAVSLLVQHLLTLFQIPQPPRIVKAAGAKEAA